MANKLNMQSIAQRVGQRTSQAPVARIYSHKVVSPEVAKVVVTLSGQPKDKAEASAAIAKALGNKVSAIANTFRTIDESVHTSRITLAGYIAPNRESMPLTEEVAGRMREMSSNILMDETDNTFWQVQKSESGASFITRQFREDLSELVSIASVKDRAVAGVEQTIASIGGQVDVKQSEYLAFVNPETASLDYGYRVTENSVFSTDSFSVVAGVDASAVVQMVRMNGHDYNEEVAAKHGDLGDAQNVKNYYEELCSSNPDFYVSLEDDMEKLSLV
ncbi:hypothetical protein GR11A_00026 [Vibrio phage vB_VcorM_GR11A]|nr:hypothetical protein GR11A_00026 [Vibrio phage vB_VcorM_GR11A]